ncbi:MAG: hypothetical protein ABIP61_02910 [Burkholderiaceae bacterium]
MTGSLAVVMAAMIPLQDMSDIDRTMRVLRHSPFSVSETVQRIGVAAHDQGLGVLAMVAGVQPVLVLASSVGGTLVVMDEADSQPAVPLSLMVRAVRWGGADVWIGSTPATASGNPGVWDDLPTAVAGDLEALPGLVDRALL